MLILSIKITFTFVYSRFTLNFYRYSFVLINQTIAEKYGTHEALFYQLINDKVREYVFRNKLINLFPFSFTGCWRNSMFFLLKGHSAESELILALDITDFFYFFTAKQWIEWREWTTPSSRGLKDLVLLCQDLERKADYLLSLVHFNLRYANIYIILCMTYPNCLNFRFGCWFSLVLSS
jgi:hypothetical protein